MLVSHLCLISLGTAASACVRIGIAYKAVRVPVHAIVPQAFNMIAELRPLSVYGYARTWCTSWENSTSHLHTALTPPRSRLPI